MAEQDIQELLLRVRSDRATIATVMRDLQQVRDGVVSIDRVKLNSLQSRIENTSKEFAQLRAEIKATADEADKLNNKQGGSANAFSGKRSAEGIGNIASLVGQFGGGEASGAIRAAAEISRVTEVLPQLATQFASLGPLGIAAAAGVGVAAAAVALLDQNSKGLSDTVRGLIAGQKEYFDIITKGTHQDVEAAIKAKQQELDTAKAQRDELVKLQADAFKDAQNQFGDAGARLAEVGARAFNVAAINDQDKAINDLNAKIAEQEFALGRLTGAMQTNTTATNDLAAAQKAQLAEFVADAKAASDEQIKLAALQRTASSQQVNDIITTNKERIDALTNEAESLKSVAGQSEEARQRLKDIQDTINGLTAENSQLSGSILRAAKAREDEKTATDAQKKASDDLAKVKTEANADAVKNAQAIKDITDKTAEAYKKLEDAYKQAGIELLAKRAADDAKNLRAQADEDAKTQRDRQVQLNELEQKQTDAYVAAEEKRNETLKKIRDQFTYDEASAIQNRDAVALDAAKRKRDKDSSDAEQSFQDDKKAADKARADSYKALQDDFKRQDTETRIQRQNAARELSIARRNEDVERRNKYLNDQNNLAAANRAAIAQQNAAYTQQLTGLQAYIGQRIKLDRGYFGDVLALATQLQTDLRNVLKGGTSTSIGAGGGSAKPATKVPPSGRYAPTQFAGGGYTPDGGLAMLHPGEMVLTAQQQKSLGGITLNVSGQGKDAVKRQINAHIDEVWSRMGW